MALSGDVTRRSEVDSVVQATLDRFGKVYFRVNDGGVLRSSSVAEIDKNKWDFVVDSNHKGAFLFSQAVLPSMRAAHSGRILNVASLAGMATSTLGGAHYTAAKAGVLGLSRHLAREMGPFQINENAICPGIVSTPMVRAIVDEVSEQRILQSIPFRLLRDVRGNCTTHPFPSIRRIQLYHWRSGRHHGGEMIFH